VPIPRIDDDPPRACAQSGRIDRFERTPDAVIALIAARQHGVVSLAQLRRARLSDGQIRSRLRRGRLHRIHHGVYAVGHARLALPGRLWAVVLATKGTLSYRTAAALWDLMPWHTGPLHVTSSGSVRTTPTIRVHRSRTLTVGDITRDPQHGLPVTTPSRTIIDLTDDDLTPSQVKRLCHRAAHLNLLDADALQPPSGRRSKPLDAAMKTLRDDGPQVPRSVAEQAFLEIVDDLGLPPPLVNEPFGPYIPDFRWPDLQLIVEIDGRSHLTPAEHAADCERDARNLVEREHNTVRFTRHQVVYRRPYVEGVMRSTLAPRA
jgi:hypothetical protein